MAVGVTVADASAYDGCTTAATPTVRQARQRAAHGRKKGKPESDARDRRSQLEARGVTATQ